MMSQLYDDFFTEFIYTNNQRLQRFSSKFQVVKKRLFSLLSSVESAKHRRYKGFCAPQQG